MTHSELAVLLTELYALRSAAAVSHKTACDCRLLTTATFCAAARDALTDAIESLTNDGASRRIETKKTFPITHETA